MESYTIASDAAILCDEEGRLKGLAPNLTFCGEELVGPILIVGVAGDRFKGLSDADAEFWLKALGGGV